MRPMLQMRNGGPEKSRGRIETGDPGEPGMELSLTSVLLPGWRHASLPSVGTSPTYLAMG